MASTRLTCPECNAVLKPAQPVPDGKRVKCPKCQSIFTAPGLVSVEEEPEEAAQPKTKARNKAAAKPAKAKAPAKEEPKPAKAPDPPRTVGTDEDDGGTYGLLDKPGDETAGPEIDHVPDTSIKDLRGPAQAAIVVPSNWVLLVGALGAILAVFSVCYSFWPFVFSEHLLNHMDELQNYYNKKGGVDAKKNIDKIPKERKNLKKEELAIVEDLEDDERMWRIIWIITFVLVALYDGVICLGAVRVQNMESRTWGLVASVMTIIPAGAGGFMFLVWLIFKPILENLFDDEGTAKAYSIGLVVVVGLAAAGIGTWLLRTLMKQEVIEGFEYKSE